MVLGGPWLPPLYPTRKMDVIQSYVPRTEDTSKFNANLVIHLLNKKRQIRLGTLDHPTNVQIPPQPSMEKLCQQVNKQDGFKKSPFYTRIDPGQRNPRPRRPLDHYVYCYIHEVGSINLVTQEFDASIYMKVTWIETSNDRADNPSRAQNMEENFDFDKWDESIVHNPNLYFKLKTGGEITSQTIRDSFFRWGKGANGKLMPVVEYSFFLKGTFTDEFNLLVFPL